MHSINIGGLASGDLTARARLRDAAIHVFGEQGFSASVRSIAQRAGASPALVIHHFGSKDKLIEACDEHVAAEIAELKSESSVKAGPESLLMNLAAMDSHAWLLGYTMRSMTQGGALARNLFEQMVSDAQEYLEQGVAAGLVRPSVDPAGRARYLTSSSVGSLLLLISLESDSEAPDYAQVMKRWEQQHMLATLEILTYGMFTDDAMFTAYHQHSPDPDPDPDATPESDEKDAP